MQVSYNTVVLNSNTNNIAINPHCFDFLFPLATKTFGILTLIEHDIHLHVGSSYLDYTDPTSSVVVVRLYVNFSLNYYSSYSFHLILIKLSIYNVSSLGKCAWDLCSDKTFDPRGVREEHFQNATFP